MLILSLSIKTYTLVVGETCDGCSGGGCSGLLEASTCWGSPLLFCGVEIEPEKIIMSHY